MMAAVIPYLKVYKDGSVVDTICLQGQDRWIAGRHAQCDIVVGHASTSRRHLEILVLYATRELLLTDLQSAHGTMVNGEAVASARPRVMQQGDTLQMGASTRSYKVEWVKEFREARHQGTKWKGEKARTQIQGRGGSTELPPRTPVRRLPFANVPASTLNSRSPAQRPGVRKSNTLPDKIIASSKVGVEDKILTSTSKEAQESGPEGSTSPNLWLRRCGSAPMPTVVTPLDAHKETEDEIDLLVLINEPSRDHLPESLKSLLSYDEYPSDKENHQPENGTRKCLSRDELQVACSSPTDRLPFAELPSHLKLSSLTSSPESDFGSRTLGLPPPQRQETSAVVNNLDSLFRNLKLGGEPRCQWHLVVDTNCLLDTDALKALKQLEGIRETRIIIPQIVLRELDGLKNRHDLGFPARVALRWIEACMEKKQSWMHMQSSTETRRRGFGTNDDQILECALLFDREVMDGSVVLLTRDTALKIKAMAEGMTVHDAASFCESLLSPYSERFLWLGSTAYRPLSRSTVTGYDESYGAPPDSPFSMMRQTIQPPPKVKQLGLDEFRCRPQGLKALLA